MLRSASMNGLETFCSSRDDDATVTSLGAASNQVKANMVKDRHSIVELREHVEDAVRSP